ncbi:MAG: 2-iminoacetate synthase ThiH [Bacteroidales bacterium]|nr:2-iminoacetate synthase ThiH [Bacteroidales bacterium]
MTFYDELKKYDFKEIGQNVRNKSDEDVLRALRNPTPGIEDFAALISPAGRNHLDEMATLCQKLSIERFGKVVQLYIPLYLSSYCTNSCVYCGFSLLNKIIRKKLTMEEIDEEIEAIKKLGYQHLLLVAGESPRHADADYYAEVIRKLRPHFAQLSIEVQPMSVEDYKKVVDAGVSSLSVYQETYNEANYKTYHPRGLKSDFRFRLETPERAAEAGMKKIGIGALLGLDDWYADAYCTALHLKYLEKRFWETRYSISLPRLRPEVGGFEPKEPVDDKSMVQLICAFRILSQTTDITLSTREAAPFRDMAIRLGINSVSAGSSTQPGGYAHPQKELEQFEINDSRTPEEMIAAIKEQGYEPVWKDWDQWL